MCLLSGRTANWSRTRPDRGAALIKHSLRLALLLCGAVVWPTPVAGNGRVSFLKQELSDSRVTAPELVLDLGVNHEPIRFTVPGLKRMTHSTAIVTDRAGKRTRRFEGVDITWLVLAKHPPHGDRTQVTVKTLQDEGGVSGERLDLDALKISFGLFHEKTIPGRNLDANSRVIILDKGGRRILPVYTPFCVIIEMGGGRRLLLRHVRRVALRPSA